MSPGFTSVHNNPQGKHTMSRNKHNPPRNRNTPTMLTPDQLLQVVVVGVQATAAVPTSCYAPESREGHLVVTVNSFYGHGVVKCSYVRQNSGTGTLEMSTDGAAWFSMGGK